MKRCLYCYQLLEENNSTEFHEKCSRKFFGSAVPPNLPYNEEEIEELGVQVIGRHAAVTGVQPKLSVDIENNQPKNEPKRLTITGLWSNYILKPPGKNYPQLPETEDVTMHLASLAGIDTVPHSLIRMQSGGLAYITRRVDRKSKKKLHMEDMCQLTERLTEDKYRGSYEQVAKTILKYSMHPGLDVVIFFEQVLFSFLTGNADMHLKNFSLLQQSKNNYTLSPAYDMVATVLVNPADDEDLALTLNGRKKKITRNDFLAAFNTLKLDPKQQQNIFNKMEKTKPAWLEFIDVSFISEDFKTAFKQLINDRFSRIY